MLKDNSQEAFADEETVSHDDINWDWWEIWKYGLLSLDMVIYVIVLRLIFCTDGYTCFIKKKGNSLKNCVVICVVKI